MSARRHTTTATSDQDRMLQLAHSFPSLRGSVLAWEPQQLDLWAWGADTRPAARFAAQFLLWVYNRHDRWLCGRFDFHRALHSWDRPHREAFISWALDPWHPIPTQPSMLPRPGKKRSPARQGSLDLCHLRPDKQGCYAWDRWQQRALAAGMALELAGLGRAVMREAAQHDWNPHLRSECGWDDQGQAMLAQAQCDPEAAEGRWQRLLDTDGERGCWTEQGEWRPFDR